MTCELCRDRLTDLLEGELAPDAERETRAHLAECAQCARALAQMQALVTVLHGLPEVEPPAGLRERLRGIPEAATPARAGGWRRARYVVATVAAAAAALLMIHVGVTHFRGDVAEPVGGPTPLLGAEMAQEPERGAEPTADAPAPPEEMVAEAAAADEEATAEVAAVADSEPEGDARRDRGAAAGGGGRRSEGGTPAERMRAESPPAPPPTDVAGGPIPMSVAHTPRVAPGPDEIEMSEAPAAEGAPPEPALAPVGGGAAGAGEPSGAAGPVGPAGPAGPAGPPGPVGPAARVGMMAAAGADTTADETAVPEPSLTLPEPQYLDAAGSTAATTGTGEGSPFVVSVMPPHQRIAGTIVPATITVETEQDVARARVTVEGSAALELVNVGAGGVLFDGPLTAGQRTVLSVRMLAREPGAQTITMRLRSTDPIVDTRLEVRMGDFVLPVPPEQRTVTFDFTDTPLREAIDSVVRQSGLRVVVDQGIEERAVTIAAPDPVPAAAALRSIAAAAGCAVREADGALIVEPREE